LKFITRHRKPLLIALALGQLGFLLTLPATRLALSILGRAVSDPRYLPYALLAPALLGCGVGFNRLMKRLPWAWLDWSLMGQRSNLALAPIRLRWFGLVYGAMLAACMPLLAFFEELIFRNGTTNWLRGLLWGGLAFGILHLVSFVSVRMTIYLSLVGVVLVGLYMSSGLIAVFVTHAVYNLLALTLMLAEQHLARAPAAVRRLTAAVAGAD
jgi:hypothetical protein